MNITNKTQLDNDLEAIQTNTDAAARRILAAGSAINRSYDTLWGLPDDRLQDVLQKLLDTGKLQSVFEAHYVAATSLNTALASAGEAANYCKSIAGREFTIEDGAVTVTPLPEPEVQPEVQPDPELHVD